MTPARLTGHLLAHEQHRTGAAPSGRRRPHRHRQPPSDRGVLWLYASVVLVWAVVAYRVAVLELPFLVVAASGVSAGAAWHAGRYVGRRAHPTR